MLVCPQDRVLKHLLSRLHWLQDFKSREGLLPNKGVGPPGTTRSWWENICPAQQQRSPWVNLIIVFSCSTQNGTSLGGGGSGAGGQDRVGSPCINQEIRRPTCQIQLYPWLYPSDGYLLQVGSLELPASVVLNHREGRLGAWP